MRVTNSYTMTEKLWEESFNGYMHRRQRHLYPVFIPLMLAITTFYIWYVSRYFSDLTPKRIMIFFAAALSPVCLGSFAVAFFTKTAMLWQLYRKPYIRKNMLALGAKDKRPYEVDVEIEIKNNKVTYKQKGFSENHNLSIKWIYETKNFLIIGFPGYWDTYDYLPLKKDSFSDNTNAELMKKYFEAVLKEYKQYGKKEKEPVKIEDYLIPTQLEGEN